MSVNRKGFTLAEIIVGVVLGTVVMTGVFRAVFSTQRNSQALAQRIDVQQTVRSAIQYLGTALRESNASDGDLLVISNNTIRFRSMRWVGVLCGPPVQVGSDVLLPLRQSLYYGVHRPDPVADSILVFRDGDPATRMDDRWLAGGLQATTSAFCSDGATATNIRLGVSVTEGGADSVMVGVSEGAPVRAFHIAELKTIPDAAGRWWLGRRTANRTGSWTSLEPVIGPIATGGFELGFYDANDNVTSVPDEVVSIAMTVRGQSLERVQARVGGYIADSLVTRVSLRNNRRF